MALADPDTASFPDLESLQHELSSLMSGLGRTHEKIAAVAREADRRNAELREKIIDLESMNLARALEVQELQMVNAELYKQWEEGWHPPEAWDRLVEERDQALEDLEKVRQVGQELLATVREYEARAKQCTCAAARATKASSDSSTVRAGRDNGRFVGRQQQTAVVPEEGPATHPHPSRATTPTPSALARWNQNDSGSATSGSSQSLGSNGSMSTQSSWDTPSSASRAIAKANQAWSLEFTKRPSTAPINRGPIPFDYLADQLMLNEETQRAVAELEHTRGYETRIHAESDFAFIYQPFILEGPGATYLVEWSTPDRPERLAKWTRTLGDLHLFIWPYERNRGWYYIGLHSVAHAEMESRWPVLERNDKRQLLDYLRKRNPDMNSVQFRNDIREGRRVQACLRLESKGLMESEDFAKEYGLMFDE